MRTISAEFYTLVTELGTRKMLKAVHDGKKVNIVEFAVGDGNGQAVQPAVDATALTHEVWRGNVNDCSISKESENVLIVESIISPEIGGFTIREMGIFDDEGDLIAICNTPDTAKVRIVDGVLSELKLQMEIILTNTESVSLTLDPSVVTASKADLEELKGELEERIKDVISEEKLIEEVQKAVIAAFDTEQIIEAFKKVYNIEDEPVDPTAMSKAQVENALETEWNGESSQDPTAMSKAQVENALETEWNGESSQDPAAMNAEEVANAIR